MKKAIAENKIFPCVDFHSHILPKMDDGSDCAEESLQMLNLSAEMGVKRLVLSSHFYPTKDSPAQFLKARQQSYEKLLTVYRRELHPQLYLAAEVAYFPGIGRCEALEELAIEGTKYILIEMPFYKWNKSVEEDILFIARQRGLTPMIAHIERYLKGNQAVVKRFRENGILIQSNAEFFLGKKKRKALALFGNGMIDLLGSDAHNMENRKPNLNCALNVIASKFSEKDVSALYRFSCEILGI